MLHPLPRHKSAMCPNLSRALDAFLGHFSSAFLGVVGDTSEEDGVTSRATKRAGAFRSPGPPPSVTLRRRM